MPENNLPMLGHGDQSHWIYMATDVIHRALLLKTKSVKHCQSQAVCNVVVFQMFSVPVFEKYAQQNTQFYNSFRFQIHIISTIIQVSDVFFIPFVSPKRCNIQFSAGILTKFSSSFIAVGFKRHLRKSFKPHKGKHQCKNSPNIQV